MLLAIILALATAQTQTGPLAPAASGKRQCYTPDTSRKTCRAMAAYRRNAAGGYDNTAIVLVSPDPIIVWETVSPVVVRDGAVCGFHRREHSLAGTLRVDGELLTGDRAAKMLEEVADAFAVLEGGEVCTTYVVAGDHLIPKVTLNGAPLGPEDDDRVIWVSPKEGYRVAP